MKRQNSPDSFLNILNTRVNSVGTGNTRIQPLTSHEKQSRPNEAPLNMQYNENFVIYHIDRHPFIVACASTNPKMRFDHISGFEPQSF